MTSSCTWYWHGDLVSGRSTVTLLVMLNKLSLRCTRVVITKKLCLLQIQRKEKPIGPTTFVKLNERVQRGKYFVLFIERHVKHTCVCFLSDLSFNVLV